MTDGGSVPRNSWEHCNWVVGGSDWVRKLGCVTFPTDRLTPKVFVFFIFSNIFIYVCGPACKSPSTIWVPGVVWDFAGMAASVFRYLSHFAGLVFLSFKIWAVDRGQ